jgi:hypothetical protein
MNVAEVSTALLGASLRGETGGRNAVNWSPFYRAMLWPMPDPEPGDVNFHEETTGRRPAQFLQGREVDQGRRQGRAHAVSEPLCGSRARSPTSRRGRLRAQSPKAKAFCPMRPDAS